MDEKGRKKQVREPPSVPFLWEVKPGFPKKDWKPEASSVPQIPKIPIKLIASVPFAWEEKPGTPIPDFSQNSVESVPPNREADLINIASSSQYSVAACNYGYDDNDKESSSDNNYEDSSDSDDDESMIGMDLKAFSFRTEESFGSVSSLLANCIVPAAKISTAIPLRKNSLAEQNSYQIETSSPPAYETGSSTSSYATGRSSPIGASFLERLFPLFPPDSGFLEKTGCSENIFSTPLELKGEDFDPEENTSAMVRRPPTLGELIMMSRRRSYRRKAVQTRIWDPPRTITTKKAFGCCMFATNSKMNFLTETVLGKIIQGKLNW